MLNFITKETKQISDEEQQRWLAPENIPPWRRQPHTNEQDLLESEYSETTTTRGSKFVMPPTSEGSPFETGYEAINAALLLRRPILVKGPPGIGKSSLAHYLAHILRLGNPLVWPINSKSTLNDGLYFYDAVGHLSAVKTASSHKSIRDFIHLRPLGEALLPWTHPKVLLIDELDKASYDLPNDLLHVLEEGSFTIPEYQRTKEQYDGDDQIKGYLNSCNGHVHMNHAPILVITSNGERDFSEAFRRRCIVVEFTKHEQIGMKEVIEAHFTGTSINFDDPVIQSLLESELPTDAILNAFFLAHQSSKVDDADFGKTLIQWLKR